MTSGTFERLEAVQKRAGQRLKRCTKQEKAVTGAFAGAVLIAIIIGASVGGSSSSTPAAPTAEQIAYQQGYQTSNNSLTAALSKMLPGDTSLRFDLSIDETLGMGNNGGTTMGNNSDTIVTINATAIKLVGYIMGGSLELKNMTEIQPMSPSPDITGAVCTKCNTCGDTNGACTSTGQCSFGGYDIDAFANPASCPSYLCNNVRQAAMISTMFEGFPNRKNYSVDPLDPPAKVSSAGAGLTPERLFKANATFGKILFSVTASFFTPVLNQSDVAIAVRVDITGYSVAQLLNAFPVLMGVKEISTMSFCKGVVVISTADYNFNGYDVVAGVNVFLRVAIPNNSTYDFMLLQKSTTPANNLFNMRLRFPISSVKNQSTFNPLAGNLSKVVLEFQKDVGVVLNQNIFDNVTRVGFQVPYNTLGGSVLGANMKLDMIGGMSYQGMLRAEKINGPTTLKVAAYSWKFPSVVTSMFNINQLGLTVENGDLTASPEVNTMNFTAKVTPKLGSWSPNLEVFGNFKEDEATSAVVYSFLLRADKANIVDSLPSIVTKITGNKAIGDFIGAIQLSDLFPKTMLSFCTSDFAEVNGEPVGKGLRLYSQVDFKHITLPSAIQTAFDLFGMKPNFIRFGFLKKIELSLDLYAFFEFAVSPSGKWCQFNRIMSALVFGPKPKVIVEVEFQLNLKMNTGFTPLLLVGIGEIGPEGLLLTAAMVGTWHSVAGIKNFDISNLLVALKISSVGIPIGAGIGGRVQLKPGTFFDVVVYVVPDDFEFAVFASIQNWGWLEVFELMQKLTGVNLGVVGTILDALTQIRINSLNLTLAPLGLDIPGHTIPNGFFIAANMTILGAGVDVTFGIMETKFEKPAILGYDFRFSFSLTDLNVLKLFVPGIGFADWLIPKITAELQKIGRICVCPVPSPYGCTVPELCFDTPLIPQISSILTDTKNALNSALVINRLSMTNISLAKIVQGDNVIELAIAVSSFGRSYSGSMTVDLGFLIQTSIATAKAYLKKLALQVLDVASTAGTIIKDAIQSLCSKLINLMCVETFIPGINRVCIPNFCK